MIVVSRESMSADGQKACSNCGRPRDRGKQRYCKRCHAQYMRNYRSGRVVVFLTPEQWTIVKERLATINESQS